MGQDGERILQVKAVRDGQKSEVRVAWSELFFWKIKKAIKCKSMKSKHKKQTLINCYGQFYIEQEHFEWSIHLSMSLVHSIKF